MIGFARWALRDGAALAAELEYEAMPRDTVAHYDSVLAALSLRRCATAISR